MHEWGIVDSLIKEVMARSKENKLGRIDRIYLSLGEDDHLTADALRLSFRVLSKGTMLEAAKLDIEKSDEKGVILRRIEGVGCEEAV